MKANLKGLGGIKHLLLAHGEKLGILIIGICAAMLIYKSLLREKLPAEKQADKLKQQITLARQNMDAFTWPKAKEQFPEEVRLWEPLDQKGSGAVDLKSYLTKNWRDPWDPAVVPPIVLRTDPVLLDPQALEARGGSGLLAFVDPVVRRQKVLEEQRKAAQLDAQQKKDLEKQAKEDERGGSRARGGGQDRMEANIFDPLHPNRRPVVGMVRPRGVPLQDYEEVRVAHWAIVVAKVPIKEQLKLYRDAFENARGYNPMTDIPQYLGYFVERAEVRSSEEDKDLKWEPVSVYNGRGQRIGPAVTTDILYGKPEDPTPGAKKPATDGVTTKWVAQMPEIVDPRFLEGGPLAFPLPPLVGRDWGPEVTHSEIPLAADAVELEEEKKDTEAAKPDAAEEPIDPFARSAAGGVGTMGVRGEMGGYGGRGGPPGMGGEYGGGMGRMGGGGRGGYGGEMYGGGGMRGYGGMGMEGAMGGRGGEMYGGGGGGRGGLGADGEPQAPNWLLRFFDFSVEPGKKYKYRVRLAMLDPNQSVDFAQLDSTVITRVKQAKAAKKSYRLTEWSKPTRTVSIPLAGTVHVASAKPASDRFNDEPKTTLLVGSFGDSQGKAIQAAKEEEFQRGSVANMTKDTEVLADQGRAIDPYKAFKFQTDITVADIQGGEKLTRTESRPARVLLMGPAGQLFVQEETEDLAVVEEHRATFAKEPPGGAGGFMGGEGRGFPGEMGPRGMGRGGR